MKGDRFDLTIASFTLSGKNESRRWSTTLICYRILCHHGSCKFVYVCIYVLYDPSIVLSIFCMPMYLFICLFIHLSIYLFIFLYIYVPNNVPLHLYLYISIYPTFAELPSDAARRAATQVMFELLDDGGIMIIIEAGQLIWFKLIYILYYSLP